MESKGLGSYRRLADRSGISHEAVRRVVLAQPASPVSIRAVADALSVDVELVRQMRGEVEFDPREWEPPESSRMLTDDERAALSRLIGVMTSGREAKGGGEHEDGSAPIGEDAPIGLDAARVARADPPPGAAASQPPNRGSDYPARGG